MKKVSNLVVGQHTTVMEQAQTLKVQVQHGHKEKLKILVLFSAYPFGV